jgi:hypothetical protein
MEAPDSDPVTVCEGARVFAAANEQWLISEARSSLRCQPLNTQPSRGWSIEGCVSTPSGGWSNVTLGCAAAERSPGRLDTVAERASQGCRGEDTGLGSGAGISSGVAPRRARRIGSTGRRHRLITNEGTATPPAPKEERRPPSPDRREAGPSSPLCHPAAVGPVHSTRAVAGE